MAGLIGMDRFEKLGNIISDEKKISEFLQDGDKVLVKGEELGSVEVKINKF